MKMIVSQVLSLPYLKQSGSILFMNASLGQKCKAGFGVLNMLNISLPCADGVLPFNTKKLVVTLKLACTEKTRNGWAVNQVKWNLVTETVTNGPKLCLKVSMLNKGQRRVFEIFTATYLAI